MTTLERETTHTLRYVEGRIEEQSSQLQALQAGQQQLQSDMNKGFQGVNARLDSRTDGIESRLNARIAESENRVNARITEVENRLDIRITEVENRLSERIDAGLAELRASNEKTNDRINKLLYIGLAVVATGVVNLAVTLSLRFL